MYQVNAYYGKRILKDTENFIVSSNAVPGWGHNSAEELKCSNGSTSNVSR